MYVQQKMNKIAPKTMEHSHINNCYRNKTTKHLDEFSADYTCKHNNLLIKSHSACSLDVNFLVGGIEG